jgi:alkylation response protein AidB-like acyl-CoA dehydrogenase
MTTAMHTPARIDVMAEGLVDAARALAPTIRAAAPDIEHERRLPASLLEALHDAGLFRMTVPRELGGLEADALTINRVAEELAVADASVAWCVLIAGAGIAVLGWLPREVSKQLASEPRVVVAGTLMPTGQATVENGGYRVTGRWAFASGIRHATSLFATCILMEGDAPLRTAAGQPVTRILVLPVEQATIQDTWHTAGLRGTGSHHFTLQDVFVPAERAIDPAPIMSGSTAAAWHPYPLYQSVTLLVSGFGGMQLGIARAALEEFLVLAQIKTPWQARQTLREQNRIQAAVARAQAQIEAARAYVHSSIADLWVAVATTRGSTPEQRARALLAQTYASDNAVDVVETLAHLAGTSTLYTPNRFDQWLRDVRAAAVHRVVSPPIYEAAGRVALGLEAATPFF